MVKIIFSPATELIVHEVVKVDKDDLIRERITPAGNMPLYWCDGILFSFSSLPMTDDIVKEYLKGRLHWLELHFCKMEEYMPIISLNDEEYKATMNVRVINTSDSQTHRDIAKWIKANVKTKGKGE